MTSHSLSSHTTHLTQLISHNSSYTTRLTQLLTHTTPSLSRGSRPLGDGSSCTSPSCNTNIKTNLYIKKPPKLLLLAGNVSPHPHSKTTGQKLIETLLGHYQDTLVGDTLAENFCGTLVGQSCVLQNSRVKPPHVNLEVQISWKAQHLVNLECRFRGRRSTQSLQEDRVPLARGCLLQEDWMDARSPLALRVAATHHPPLIAHRPSHTTHLTPLITHHSSHTTFILHHSSHTTHLTPLITHHSSHTTHLTPLITHHSPHTTHLIHFYRPVSFRPLSLSVSTSR